MKKLLVLFLCFSVLAGVAGLVGCETVNPENSVACNHQFGEWETIQATTCSVKGRRDRVCKLCGEKEVAFDEELLPHNFVDGVCTICGGTVEVCRHEFGDWYVSTPATCTVAEVISRDCPLCGHTENQTNQVSEHLYGDWVTVINPTCTTAGMKKQICATCGDEKVAEIELLGHNYGDWVLTEEPECETVGTETRTCLNECGKTESRSVSALGHTYGDWNVTTEPECEVAGEKTRICSVCGDVNTDDVPAKGHSYSADTGFCVDCSAECEHVYGEWKDVTPPTCTEAGVHTKECTICKFVVREAVEALGHVEVIDEAVEPTCTETGLTEGKHCSVCNEVLEAQESVKTVEHSYGEWQTITPATCTANGSRKHVCTVCGFEELGSTDALGHNFGPWVTTKDAECGVEGIKTSTCLNEGCDTNIEDEEVTPAQKTLPLPALEHNYVDNECVHCGKEADEKTGLQFTLSEDETYYVVSGVYKVGAKVTVPAYYKDIAVKAIADGAFEEELTITSIVVEAGIESIGNRAFYGAKALTSVELPNTLVSIGEYAFAGCEALKEIALPNSVTSLGACTFYNCPQLASVKLSEGLTTLPEYIFYACSSLTRVEIPESVTFVGYSAFYGCTALQTVTIPAGVEHILTYTFSSCTNLKSVVILGTVKTVGVNAFANCVSLEKVYFAGSEEQFANVTISQGNDALAGAAVYFYSESAPAEAGNFWHFDQEGNPVIW